MPKKFGRGKFDGQTFPGGSQPTRKGRSQQVREDLLRLPSWLELLSASVAVSGIRLNARDYSVTFN
jgi:hypothetical protein